MDKQRADRFIWRDGDTDVPKPTVKLMGTDGNAFSILGLAIRAAKKAGWSQAQLVEYKQKATSGDYNNLLAVTMELFEVK